MVHQTVPRCPPKVVHHDSINISVCTTNNKWSVFPNPVTCNIQCLNKYWYSYVHRYVCMVIHAPYLQTVSLWSTATVSHTPHSVQGGVAWWLWCTEGSSPRHQRRGRNIAQGEKGKVTEAKVTYICPPSKKKIDHQTTNIHVHGV